MIHKDLDDVERDCNRYYQVLLTVINSEGFKFIEDKINFELDQHETIIKQSDSPNKEWLAGYLTGLEFIDRLLVNYKNQLINIQQRKEYEKQSAL